MNRTFIRVTQNHRIWGKKTKTNPSYLTGWACVLSETDGEISSSLRVGFRSTRQTFDACCKAKRKKGKHLGMLTSDLNSHLNC